MYKIVNIVDLKRATAFDATDQVIEFSNDKSKMYIGKNDYEHKNKSYLSECIDIVDSALNSYLTSIDTINTTYITSTLRDVYIPDNHLIKTEYFDKVMTSDAFLTKETCKNIEAECISYVNEMKNKAVSLIIGKLNNSFVEQNSVGRYAFGQTNSDGTLSSPDGNITYEEKTNGEYNFETGEFSLGQLLYSYSVSYDDPSTIATLPDFWKDHWDENFETYFRNEQKYNNAKTAYDVVNTLAEVQDVLFNASLDKNPQSFCITVPSASYDDARKQTVPVAQLIKLFLKRQIRIAIKRVCETYLDKMVEIPIIETPDPQD